jgi:hypothetical protein
MLEDILLKLVSAHFNATGVTLELVFSSVLVSGCGTQSSRIFLLWPSHVACVVISFRVIMHLLLDSLLLFCLSASLMAWEHSRVVSLGIM